MSSTVTTSTVTTVTTMLAYGSVGTDRRGDTISATAEKRSFDAF
jgi:hypothetical protein